MRIIDLIHSNEKTAFSFEILPPLKGTGIEKLYDTIDTYGNLTRNTSISPHIAANMCTKIWETVCFSAIACAAAQGLLP